MTRLIRSSKLPNVQQLCYKRSMAKWFRRKKAAPESESTGKIGQVKDPHADVLQPSYDEDFTQRPPVSAPEPQRVEHEPQPSHATHADMSFADRVQQPAKGPVRDGKRRRGGRGRGRRGGRGPASREATPRQPSAAQQARQASVINDEARIQAEEARRRMEVETQPESPNAPPASAAHAMGNAPAHTQPGQRPPRGVVVLAIGLPGSGKTTWFKRRGVTPLSSDMLRTILFDNITEQRYQSLVFSTLRSLLRARLVAHMPWNYVDATNLSPKERKQWIQMARSLGYEVQAVFFDVPVEVCLDRNRRRERVVPDDVMQRMAAKLRPPTFEEGFSKIIVVRVKSREGSANAGTEDDLA